MSFSETFAVIGLVAAGLVALVVAATEPPLQDVAECAGCAAEVTQHVTHCEGC